jgi:hypothetical protein
VRSKLKKHNSIAYYTLGYMVLPMFLDYKPVQHVTVLNTVGNCNTMASIIILYDDYNIMGSPSYMRSVADRNVVMYMKTYVHLL